MNNPISTVLRRPRPGTGRNDASGSLSDDTFHIKDKSGFNDDPKSATSKAREKHEWEFEEEEDTDWFSEASDVVRLAFMTPISTFELVGKSMSQADCTDTSTWDSRHDCDKVEVNWGSGEEWLEEIGHVFKLSLSAPVTCIELLGKSMDNSEDDRFTI